MSLAITVGAGMHSLVLIGDCAPATPPMKRSRQSEPIPNEDRPKNAALQRSIRGFVKPRHLFRLFFTTLNYIKDYEQLAEYFYRCQSLADHYRDDHGI
ncbi:MAG: hypothetical protein AAFX52_03585 [Pseudomonadota bacterium]